MKTRLANLQPIPIEVNKGLVVGFVHLIPEDKQDVMNNDINLGFGRFRSIQDEPQTMSCKPRILANLEKVRCALLPKKSAQILTKTSVTT